MRDLTEIRKEVYKLIDGEREYQDTKWNHPEEIQHNPIEWVAFMEDYLLEAKHILTREPDSQKDAMSIIRKVTALGVAAMEQWQTPKR